MPLPSEIRVIPVIDVRSRTVVRAVGGRRNEYLPLTSCVTSTTDPLVVAADLRSVTGSNELYLADLDALLGGIPNIALIHHLAKRGHRLWVDVGLRQVATAVSLVENYVAIVVAALETVKSPDDLRKIIDSVGADRVAFSFDMRSGVPVHSSPGWPAWRKEIIRQAVLCGVRRMIFLDLARVGMNEGVGTEDLCRWTHLSFPNVEIIVGGGVRGPGDLLALKDAGVSAALVASAIHDGMFTQEEGPL